MIGLLLFALFLSGTSSSVLPRAVCSINLWDLDPEPIVADTAYQFIYPEPEASSISLNTDDTILISCPGGNLDVNGQSYLTVQAACVAGTQFTIESAAADFNAITCSRNPFHTARYTGGTCEENGLEIEIGFILDDSSFVRQIIICFDQTYQTSLYSVFNLTRSIVHHESGIPRPSFIQDDFYNVGGSVNYLYERVNQRATINALVGLSSTSTKYVQDGNDYFLARGHLTAKADFVYAPQQFATFHYVNVAPQWQTFNGANWNQAEMDVRSYAENNVVDLVVYTGTYGVATLPHEDTGEEIELYLYNDGTNKGLTVPKVYWKVVHNQATAQGVALVGVNNPYATVLSDSIICEDISDQITWLNWSADDLVRGYSYACTVDDLRSIVPHVPNLNVQGGLLL